MATTISASVGKGGVNHQSDVRAVQELLNKIAADQGGPEPRLVPDGLIGPKTIAAIKRFQKHHGLEDDGKVDPDRNTLAMLNAVASQELALGQRIPNKSEKDVSGVIAAKIKRDTPEFLALISNINQDIVFKDEEATGADRMMTVKLQEKLDALAVLVKQAFPGKKLRVTECWDENDEHSAGSLHYEGRAADLTVSDRDSAKLGKLAWLAVEAGFDWVLYEDSNHVHVSVSK